MTLRFRTIVVLALSVVGALAVASSANAATSTWSTVEITLLADQQPVLLVAGTAPADAPLPFQGELAVPAGSPFLWLGEIVGTDPSKDPALQYTKRTEGDLDIYSFTMTQSRTAQLEITPAGASTSDGTNKSTQISWKAWADIASVRIAERLVAGSQVVQAAEGATLNPVGPQYLYYEKTVPNVKAGDVVGLAFTYTPGPPVPTGSTATTGTAGPGAAGTGITLKGVLIPAAVVLLVGALVAFARIGRAGAAQTDEDDKEPIAAAQPRAKPKAETEQQPQPQSKPKPKAKPKADTVKPSDEDAFFDEDEVAETKPTPTRRRK